MLVHAKQGTVLKMGLIHVGLILTERLQTAGKPPTSICGYISAPIHWVHTKSPSIDGMYHRFLANES